MTTFDVIADDARGANRSPSDRRLEALVRTADAMLRSPSRACRRISYVGQTEAQAVRLALMAREYGLEVQTVRSEYGSVSVHLTRAEGAESGPAAVREHDTPPLWTVARDVPRAITRQLARLAGR